MSTKIPISQLGVLSYCEYRIYLKEHLKKQKIRVSTVPNAAMLAGLQAHRKLKKESEKIVQTPQKQINRELNVIGTRLRGRMDELQVLPNCIRIIEDKPREVVYEGDRLQVLAYCKTYKEQNNIKDIKIIAIVRSWKTNKEVWEKVFTDEDDELIDEKVDRIIGILDGSITPTSTHNPRKCEKCNLKKVCDKSLYQPFDVNEMFQ